VASEVAIAALRRFARETLHKITAKPFTSPTAGHSQRPVIGQQRALKRTQEVPNSASRRHKYLMMITFWEWLGQGYEYGFVLELQRLLREMRGDEGYQAFIQETNREFRTWIGTILRMGKFSDPRNEAEARAIVADPDYFSYAQELVAAASGGRARLRGQDVLDGAQDVNMQLWKTLLNPKLCEAEGVTWESRNPLSVQRNGIRGTIRAWARYKAGHFAARLNKLRSGVTTHQISQIQDPDQPFELSARPAMSDLEWEDLKQAIISDLEAQLRKEIEAQGPHWQSRVRNLRWAVEIVKRQMAIPWEWRSMPAIADEIPGLEAGLRGGLADQLKRRIDQARRKALGEARLSFLQPADRGGWPLSLGRANPCDSERCVTAWRWLKRPRAAYPQYGTLNSA
jgi:hypothetical protein